MMDLQEAFSNVLVDKKRNKAFSQVGAKTKTEICKMDLPQGIGPSYSVRNENDRMYDNTDSVRRSEKL